MKFYLSNRQRKEIERFSREVSIAIPHPAYEADPLEYFREHVDVRSDWIRRAEVIELTVRPYLNVAVTLDDISTFCGQIVHDAHLEEIAASNVTLQVTAIVATICRVHRGDSATKTQWAWRCEL